MRAQLHGVGSGGEQMVTALSMRPSWLGKSRGADVAIKLAVDGHSNSGIATSTHNCTAWGAVGWPQP